MCMNVCLLVCVFVCKLYVRVYVCVYVEYYECRCVRFSEDHWLLTISGQIDIPLQLRKKKGQMHYLNCIFTQM